MNDIEKRLRWREIVGNLLGGAIGVGLFLAYWWFFGQYLPRA